MAENSSIEWCDATFNPWSGCTKISPGCVHCYADTLSKRNPKTLGVWGKGNPRVRTGAKYWQGPVRWNADAAAGRFRVCLGCGRRELRKWDVVGLASCSTPGCLALSETESSPVRPRVFCASLADWLDDEVEIEWLADLLDLIRQTPNLDWLLLTKRPQNFHARVTRAWMETVKGGDFESWCYAWTGEKGSLALRPILPEPPANVWIGTTVEDQARADERIPLLLSIPAKVRFLSCEPLLGPLDLEQAFPSCRELGCTAPHPQIHWVIAGGESGPGARPMHPDWARSLRDQCQAAGVPFLFKQWGEYAPNDGQGTKGTWHGFHDGQMMKLVGKKAAGRLLDGREWNEFPRDGQPASALPQPVAA